jgi:hypothetical protein
MRLPLTLKPRPSRLLYAAMIVGHLGAVAVLAKTAMAFPLLLLCWLPIAASLAHSLSRLARYYPVCIILRDDGWMDIEWTRGKLQLQRVGKNTVVLPWLVVVDCDCAGRRRYLTLPADALEAESQRLLRLWLRWQTQPKAVPTP